MNEVLKLSKWLGIPLLLIYLIAMVVVPVSSGSWEHIQGVWDRWQALNVGVLAFASSLIALNLSSYLSKHKSEKELDASLAILPAALSELCYYTEKSALFYSSAWRAIHQKTPLESKPPETPISHQAIFQECIKHSKPNVGSWMSEILMQLQINSSRMRYFVEEADSLKTGLIEQRNILSQLFYIAELRARIDRLYPFARKQKTLESKPLNQEDFDKAYSSINIIPEDFSHFWPGSNGEEDLQEFTIRQLEQYKNTN